MSEELPCLQFMETFFGSDVKKEISINYTGGYALDFSLNEDITLKVGRKYVN